MASLDTSPSLTAGDPTAGRADALPRAFAHVSLVVGGFLLVLILLAAVCAPLLTAQDPYTQDLSRRLAPPIWHENGSWTHVLGTDALGRDYLARVLYGARVSLAIGFSAAAISAVIGIALGVAGGYFGGRTDQVVTFILNVRLALPAMLVALVVVVMAGNSTRTVIYVIGFLMWDRFIVVARSATQQIRSLDYLAAARATGCGTPRILWSEVLPNIAGPLIVVATLEVANAILFEAALSFLNLGVQPPIPSWGLMISEAKPQMFLRPWMIAIPGVALFVLVLAINLLGDGIRDVTAPEGRE